MRFYVLGDLRTNAWTYQAFAGRMKATDVGEAPECPVCGDVIGMLPWIPPYHVEITIHGNRLGDIIRSTGRNLLVTDRFRNAWETDGLRGIETFSPLERIRVRPARFGKKTPTYFHVAVHHFGTQVDVERSLIEYTGPLTCPKCKGGDVATVRGFAIDESSWTGEDLFYAWGADSSFIVTDRVREMRDKYGLTNMNMTPVEEYLWDPLNQWTPVDYSPDEPPPEADEVVDEDNARLN